MPPSTLPYILPSVIRKSCRLYPQNTFKPYGAQPPSCLPLSPGLLWTDASHRPFSFCSWTLQSTLYTVTRVRVDLFQANLICPLFNTHQCYFPLGVKPGARNDFQHSAPSLPSYHPPLPSAPASNTFLPQGLCFCWFLCLEFFAPKYPYLLQVLILNLTTHLAYSNPTICFCNHSSINTLNPLPLSYSTLNFRSPYQSLIYPEIY